jgi:hypothetical protein
MEQSSRRSLRASDARLFRRALAIGLLGLLAVASVAVYRSGSTRPLARLQRFEAPAHVTLPARTPRLEAQPITPELRRRGYHECAPLDPLGLGPYAPYRNVRMGRMAIPQRGGHTADYGYDVIVHFHGHSPVRRTLVQVARGVSFVGIDLGVGSGYYSNPFRNPKRFPKLLLSIEDALRHHSGEEGAHIRYLALSAWSAGYGAVNEILRYHADRVDAVILLDGLHAAWSRTHRRRDGSVESVCERVITPVIDFARRAMCGEGIFIFSHSQVDPTRYPSTALTADLLLDRLGLERGPGKGYNGRYAQVGAVDVEGLHVWSYEGGDEHAHCAHISLIARAVRDVIEPAWQTPAMDRNVPPTPAPELGAGNGARSCEAESDAVVQPGRAGQLASAGRGDRSRPRRGPARRSGHSRSVKPVSPPARRSKTAASLARAPSRGRTSKRRSR